MSPYYACGTCERRLYKATGALRCHMKNATRCSHYIGPKPEMHVKLKYGPDYFTSLARAGIRR